MTDFVRKRRARGAIAVALALAALAALPGCGATLSRAPLLGEPEDAPRAPAEPAEFPNVGAKVGPEHKPMTAEERARLQHELAVARDQAAAEKRRRIQEDSRR